MLHDCLIKENSAMVLFASKDFDIKDKQKEFLVWAKIVGSFRYDDDVVFNLIYINHPMESYIGFCLRAEQDIMPIKVKRYSEGLAYLLVYYFPNATIRVLTYEESHALTDNLADIKKVPASLCQHKSGYLDGANDCLQIVFSRVVDPKLVLDKFREFYGRDRKKKPTCLENRIGVKPSCDERIVSVLKNAYLAYSFKFFNSVFVRNGDIHSKARSNIIVVSRNTAFVYDFIEKMSVPDKFVDKIEHAKNTGDLFDDPDLMLVPAEIVTQFILGYK